MAGYVAGFAAFLFSRLRLPDCLCRSAQASHLVWPSMARFGQLTHSPVSLAVLFDFRRFCRWCSFRSSGVFLTLGLAAFSAGVVFVGGFFFGAGEGLTVLGLLSCFLSSGLSRIGVDAGLLRGPYSAPNLLGSGKVMAKVMPTARLGGGNLNDETSSFSCPGSIPACAGNAVGYLRISRESLKPPTYWWGCWPTRPRLL